MSSQHRVFPIAGAALMLAVVACTCGTDAVFDQITSTLEAESGVGIDSAEQAPVPDTDNPAFELSQFADQASATSQYGSQSWSAGQMVDIPDTDACGDITTAWASDSPDGPEQLTLGYAVSVIPTQINIYETYNPGAIVQVAVVSESGGETVVYEAAQQVVEECPRILSIEVDGVTDYVQQVVIRLDETNHPSWNEIDAVQLIGIP